jgi:hypothetical protein
MTADQRAARASHMTVRRFASSADADRHDLEFWVQIPEAQRIREVWRLSQEVWRLRGDHPDEPGFCRSVASIHRR